MIQKKFELIIVLSLGLGLTGLQAQKTETFTDSRDSNVYKTIKIGNQVWMSENLRYLPIITSSETGSTLTQYYYVYDYNGTVVSDAKAITNYTNYGVLYNWPAAMNGAISSKANPSGVKGVCPSGWHLPSDAEWTQLINYLGGSSDAGGKLKEKKTTHWNSPNTKANNKSGFTALPGGYRNDKGVFDRIGYSGNWWSATERDTVNAWYRIMLFDDSEIYGPSFKKELGLSVRCVKD
jgi:uncharacterized protein (TIGR02145 family)